MGSLEENPALRMTPFEKNLEVWRQLWRVVERSDVVVQVVDARQPLLYRCEDLEVRGSPGVGGVTHGRYT